MEVIAASNFLSEFVNAIVNACIVYNIMVTAVCTRIEAGRLYGLQYEGK